MKMTKQIELKDEIQIKLEGMGFIEDENKPGLWKKSVEGGTAHWDFRKTTNGRFYIGIENGGFMDDKDAKEYQEYKVIRGDEDNHQTDKEPKDKPKTEKPSTKIAVALRGTENDISRVVKSRRMDVIIRSSPNENKPGEGVLFYDIPKIGLEPSVELIDMICADMGNIQVEILEQGQHRHIDVETGEEYQTYYAIVKARDLITGTEGIGTAEEIIDFKEMKNQKRTFSLTKAIRKSERNAKERLIPVPRKAMVVLVQDMIEEYQKGNK